MIKKNNCDYKLRAEDGGKRTKRRMKWRMKTRMKTRMERLNLIFVLRDGTEPDDKSPNSTRTLKHQQLSHAPVSMTS